MGEVLRYPKPANPSTPIVDGYRNFFWVTGRHGGPAVQLEAGINAPRNLITADGERLAVILISSSPHKVGGVQTPWQDIFAVDNGHIRYFGDNKTIGQDPLEVRGNALLRAAWEVHQGVTEAARRKAVPIVFFRRVARLGRQKGFIRFEGFGIVRRCELIAQASGEGSFSNLVFDFIVFDLAAENERFDWAWIDVRRDKTKTEDDAAALAPAAWKRWIADGENALPILRRNVATRSLVPTKAQRPEAGSGPGKILQMLHASYKGREAAFEGVAAWAAHRILGDAYRPFGVTRASGDRGFDFVGRLDLGHGFGTAKLVVLGQAKCEKLDSPTTALHLARTVARLRRGWLGVYVTTSYFSTSAQTEVVQDRYPLLLVNGFRLATEIDQELNRIGGSFGDLLMDIEERYGRVTELSDPDQVLFIP
jgi:Restriction endonuclease AspBHI N-terminal/Restriction endonuclease